MGLVEQKNVVFNSLVCYYEFTRVLKWPTRAKKRPNLYRNSSNKLLLYFSYRKQNKDL
jgi:hypothetical protein